MEGNIKMKFIPTGDDGRDIEAEQQALLAQTVNPTQATTPTSAIETQYFLD